jgi:sulfide:quinone oxidoreductase
MLNVCFGCGFEFHRIYLTGFLQRTFSKLFFRTTDVKSTITGSTFHSAAGKYLPMKQKEYPEIVGSNLKKESPEMSRRDALKLMGISPITAAVIAGTSTVATRAEASDATGKIVIVGGGTGGIIALARLHRALSKPDITLIAPNEIHLYQPGQIFMASGEYTFDDIIKGNDNYIPEDVTWIKDEVAAFDPDNNSVTTRKKKKISYDYLVVATGIVGHYDWIKGLEEKHIGTNGIASVYLNDLAKGTARGGKATRRWFDEIREAAKHTKPTILYTQPDTPIKCEGGPQQILFLSADYLKKEDLGAKYIFTTAHSRLFDQEPIAKSLNEAQKRYDTISNKFGHKLVAIDVKKKIATYKYTHGAKGTYGEGTEALNKTEYVKIKYDFIHVVPPMGPPKSVVDSPLGWQEGSLKGWLEVDKETLQHRRYKNVFGIGDICGIPLGKTGGSARRHGPVVQDNLIALMEGKKELPAKFDGYTVCPLKTKYGKTILAEFDFNGPAPSLPFPDPVKAHWIWWVFDLYMLKPIYWQLIMRGLM